MPCDECGETIKIEKDGLWHCMSGQDECITDICTNCVPVPTSNSGPTPEVMAQPKLSDPFNSNKEENAMAEEKKAETNPFSIGKTNPFFIATSSNPFLVPTTLGTSGSTNFIFADCSTTKNDEKTEVFGASCAFYAQKPGQ